MIVTRNMTMTTAIAKMMMPMSKADDYDATTGNPDRLGKSRQV